MGVVKATIENVRNTERLSRRHFVIAASLLTAASASSSLTPEQQADQTRERVESDLKNESPLTMRNYSLEEEV